MNGILILGGIVAVLFVLLFLLSGVRAIPNTRIGIVEKRFSPKGSVKSGFIALNGEAGFQPKCSARWSALPDADPVCCPYRAAGDHPAGQDRLHLRA